MADRKEQLTAGGGGGGGGRGEGGNWGRGRIDSFILEPRKGQRRKTHVNSWGRGKW